MGVYKYLQNPLIFYTDSKKFAQYFEKLRQNSTYITKVISFSRGQLWPFQILPELSKFPGISK
jgi:UDP-galactopyranose mutase